MPKFSVIIPAYMAEDRIRKVCYSVRYQENIDHDKDVELIVVCDRCTDNTEKIAREEFNAITAAVDFGNDGSTRSKGLDLATGDWVLFLDDDDWWLHEYVLDLINKSIDYYENDSFDILQFGFIWKTKGYYGSRYTVDETGHMSIYSNIWTKCFRREFIGDIRFPAVHSISDAKFINQLAQKNPRVKFLDLPMYYYNWLRPGSISQKDVEEKGHNTTL